MAINQQLYQTPRPATTEMDWSPLRDLVKQYRDQAESDEAAKLLAGLYGNAGGGQAAPNAGPGGSPLPPQRFSGPVPPALADNAPAPPDAPLPVPVPGAPSPYWKPTQVGDASWAPGQPTAAPPPRAMPPNLFASAAPAGTARDVPTPPSLGQLPPAQVAWAPPPTAVASGPSPFGPAPGAVAGPPAGVEPPPDAVAAAAVPMPRERPAAADVMSIAAPPAREPQPAAPAAAPEPIDRVMAVIRQKESSGNYQNVTTTRNRAGQPQHALGAYGVMSSNLPEWSREVLGRTLSPQEFLASREAQDAIARAKLSEYAGKYGYTGAAKAWFAGEKGMNNPSARDPLGTTVSSYAADFERKMGGDLPAEITSGRSRPAGVGAPPSGQAMSFSEVAGQGSQYLTNPDQAKSGLSQEQLTALYKNPQTRALAVGVIQKQLDPGTWKFMAVGDNVLKYNERTGQREFIHATQKPIAVPNESSLYVNGQWVTPPGGGNTDRFGKLPDKMRWKDPNDKSKGVEDIPGTGEKIEAEVGARLGLARSYFDTLPDLKARIDRGDVGIDNPLNHAQAIGNVGVPGETNRMVNAGAEALVRMLTGAGIGVEEAKRNAAQYGISPTDTAWTVKSKVNALEKHLYFIADTMGKGRGGNALLKVPEGYTPSKSVLSGATGGGQQQGGGGALAVGHVYNGYKYLGGNSRDPKSWAPVQ